MDAYDIFKKLTKGLTFKNHIYNTKPENKTLAKEKFEPKFVKEEQVKEEIFSDDEVLDSDTSYNKDHSDSEGEVEGGELQLMTGVKVGDKKKKKKHREKTEDLKKKLEIEEQNRFRNEYGIRAVGRHIPAALHDFVCLRDRYGVAQATIDTIRECGYTEPTPIQRQAMPCMLEDRQILACAPTGSGKTAAFLVPILHNLGEAQGGPRALILCPTRELAKQIYREALRLSAGTNLRCSIISKIQESKIKERESTVKKSDIVISTPNRLCYLMSQDNVNITLYKVKWLVIDEADKMFEGSTEREGDFRQQLDAVVQGCGGRGRRVAMFSATHTPAVAKWCRHNLRGLINITVGQRNAATNTVEQELLYCGNESGKLVAFRQLVQGGLKPPVLVFVQSKDRAKQLFKELIYDGINVDVIHADRTQTQRDNVVRSFRIGRIWVLICTELMGRGIDFRGVNLVINYDFPPSAISYVHRVGRAGRAGQKGRAVTYFTQDDLANLRSIAAVMKQSGCEVPEFMLKLKQNPNKRKKFAKKAPNRDKISTVLEKRSQKRKLGDGEDRPAKTKDTQTVETAKNRKNRKITNGKPTGDNKKTPKNNSTKNMKKQKKVISKKIKKKNP